MDGPSQDDERMSWLQMSIFQPIGRPKPFVSNIVRHSEHSGRKEQAQKKPPKNLLLLPAFKAAALISA